MTPNRVMSPRLQFAERPPLPLEQQVEQEPSGRIGERLEHELEPAVVVTHEGNNR